MHVRFPLSLRNVEDLLFQGTVKGMAGLAFLI